MLAILVYWVFIFFSLSFWGKLFLKGFDQATPYNPFRVAFYGFPLAILLLGTLAFILPGKLLFIINAAAGLLFGVHGGWRRELIQGLKREAAALLAIASIIAFFSLRGYIMTDHYFYYLPSESWIWNFGWVKGISNLYLPLGQGSFWHMYEATWGSGEWTILNGFLSSIAFGFIWMELRQHRNNALVLLIPLVFAYLFSSANSPDYPLIVFGSFLVYEWLNERQTSLIWPFLMFGIKLVATPFLLLAAPILLGFKKGFNKKFILLTLVGIALFVLAGAKNFFQTGLVLFPYDFIPVEVSWKTPAVLLQMFQQGIEAYGLNESSQLPIQELTFVDRIQLITNLQGIKGAINTVLLALYVLGTFRLVWLFINNQANRLKVLSVAALVTAYFLIWIYMAPQYRFFLPAIVILLVTNAYFLPLKRIPIRLAQLGFFLLLLVFVSLSFLSPKLTDNRLVVESWHKRNWNWATLVIPQAVPSINQEYYEKAGVNYNYPEEGKYFGNAPLPGLFPYYDSIILEQNLMLIPFDRLDVGRGFYLQDLNSESDY